MRVLSLGPRLDSLKLFVRAARTGSFSRAGRDLGLTQPVVSRSIAALEKELGTALFTRTTRAVALTDAGRDLLARIEPILDELEEAYHAARSSAELRGVLRIGMSSSFGIREVIPLLPAFVEAHPNLKIELLMSDQRQDLVLDGVDVALRLGPLPDSSARSRSLGTLPRMMMASPGYLSRVGTPKQPADLAHHRIITGPGSQPASWTLRRGAQVETVRLEGHVRSTLNEGAIAAAVAGLGIMLTGAPGESVELKNGALVQVLPQWQLQRLEVHALYAAGRGKPAARALTEHLVRQFRERDVG
jgi:DNA-binding transcriptional LysR family regulator